MNLSPRSTKIPDYLDFFGLRDHPFRITPDTDYFYPSPAHQAALEALRYGILRREGFLVLTGEPGVGKTLLIRMLFEGLPPEVQTAMILTPTLGPEELLEVILEDLGLSGTGSREKLIRRFRDRLFELAEKGHTLLLVIDEAQNLPPESLEELRLLSNFETEKGKLLQILLSGQPALEERLRSPELSQLAQRITVWERLRPLTREEIGDYVRFRLARAGGAGVMLARGTERELERWSGGIPRVINKIMDRALLVAFARGSHRLHPALIREAAAVAALPSAPMYRRRIWLWGAVVLGMLLMGVLVYVFLLGG